MSKTPEEIAEQILPCLSLSQSCDPDVNGYSDHSGECPASWRPEVASAIAKERERVRQLCAAIKNSSYKELHYIWSQVQAEATNILTELEKETNAGPVNAEGRDG